MSHQLIYLRPIGNIWGFPGPLPGIDLSTAWNTANGTVETLASIDHWRKRGPAKGAA